MNFSDPFWCAGCFHSFWSPHTWGHIQEFKKLATAIAQETDVGSGPTPPNLLDKQLGFLPGIVTDRTPFGVMFGDCKKDVPVNSSYRVGETVSVVFHTGCPRNDLYAEGTYALVELLDPTGVWKSVYDDDDWSVKFTWTRPLKYSTYSFAQIDWTVPETSRPGVYRIRHFGAYKHYFGSVKHFTGTSSAFVVSTWRMWVSMFVMCVDKNNKNSILNVEHCNDTFAAV